MENFNVAEIINLFNENRLSDLNLEYGNFKLQLKKRHNDVLLKDIEQLNDKDSNKEEIKNLIKVKSPQVGKIAVLNYCDKRDENKTVKKGDVLCIIEAMKMMNEIISPIDGTIQLVNVEEDEVIEYGQILFEILPV